MQNLTPSLREQGIQALREGDAGRAVDLLSRAVAADPEDGEARAFLGVAYSQEGLHAQAKEALLAAVARQPQNSHHRFNLGVVLERMGDREGAARAFVETLRLQPDHAQARARLQALGPPAAEATGRRGDGATGRADDETLEVGTAPWLRGGSSPGIGAEAPAWVEEVTVPAMRPGEAFLRRLAATILDFAIVAVASYAVFFIFGFLLVALAGGISSDGQGPTGPGVAVLGVLLSLGAFVVLPLVYYVGMLRSRGQTLGKMALGVRVIDASGENPGVGRALLREVIGKLCSTLVLFLGFFWMLWDRGQQTWHDKIAGTYVERADAAAARAAGGRVAYGPAQPAAGLIIAVVVLFGGLFFVLPIMAAILFPVFAQAREKARATACMSNLKQLSTGMMMYAQDYDGRLPDRRNWGDALFPYVKNPRAYQCPSLPRQRGTYAYNAGLSRASVNQLDAPARTVAGFDSRGGWNLAGGPELADARHNQGLYVMFADGRIQWKRDFSGVVWKPRPPAAGRSAARRSRSRRGR